MPSGEARKCAAELGLPFAHLRMVLKMPIEKRSAALTNPSATASPGFSSVDEITPTVDRASPSRACVVLQSGRSRARGAR